MGFSAEALLVGLGGLGCPTARALVEGGVCSLTLLDNDTVSLSNLHRQTLFEERDVGEHKAVLGAERLRVIGEAAKGAPPRIEPIARRFAPEHALQLAEQHKVLVEGADNFATKFLAADAAYRAKTASVQAGVVRWSGWAHAYVPGSGGACLRCIFEDLPDTEVETCAVAGVIGPVVGVVASLASSLALRVLRGDTTASGELWHYDAKTGRMGMLRPRPRPDCALCSPAAIPPSLELSCYL